VIILGGTSDKLQVYSTSAVTVDAHASWTDYDGTTLTPGRTNTALTAATTTYDVVGSPSGIYKRNVKALTLRNKHASSSNLLIVKHTDGSTTPELISHTLLAGETLQYFEKQGWSVLTALGDLKMLTVATGRFLKRTFLVPGATTFQVSPYTSSIRVKVQAGGGGGGGATRATNAPGFAGGGAAGGYAEKFFAVTPLTTYACVVGGGGAGGTAGANGTAGSNSTFAVGGTTVTAFGGPGGIAMASAATRQTSLGGASPAVSTNGDLNSGGQPGRCGIRDGTTDGCSGQGGSSYLGPGANGLTTQGTGNSIASPGGGGGGGAAAISANISGGAGSPGVIIVEEYE